MISRGEKVGVEVQVVVTGEAAADTLVTQELNTIEVEADVSNIPEQIEVSVEGLTAGTQIHASDVPLPEGTTLRTDAEILVVNVVAGADRGPGRGVHGHRGRRRRRGAPPRTPPTED